MEKKRPARPKGDYLTYRRFAYYLQDIGMPSQTLWQAKFPAEWDRDLSSLAHYISQKDKNWYLPFTTGQI